MIQIYVEIRIDFQIQLKISIEIIRFIYIFPEYFCLADVQFVEPMNEIKFAPFDIEGSKRLVYQIVRLTQLIDTVIVKIIELLNK